MQESRQALRQRILAARDGLASEVRRRASAAICARLWQIAPLAASRIVLAYVSFRSEVETAAFIDAGLVRQLRMAVPRTDSQAKRLTPFLISDPARDLRPGYCGIPEPDPARAKVLDPALLDVVVVPGSVFDCRGGRLGYGGGYYDRFLANDAPQALRVGVAYDTQLVDEVPMQPHDARLHWLVTETRLIEIR